VEETVPVISVITPVHDGRSEVVLETGESLAAQELPAGWTLEWLVQEDSARPSLADAINAFPFARYQANGEHLGIAPSRNLALGRSTGTLVHPLDSDDMLLPGCLAVAIEAFRTHPSIGWVATQAYDLMPDGSHRSFAPLIEPGPVPAGFVATYYFSKADRVAGHGRLPFHPACTTLRADLVHALGGWGGLPRLEDLSLITAITDLAPGYFTPEVGFLRRRHDSVSVSERWLHLMPESQATVERRVQAIRALGLDQRVL
jgi:GT2 family glycosyltransferase